MVGIVLVLILVVVLPIAHVVYVHGALNRLRRDFDRLQGEVDHLRAKRPPRPSDLAPLTDPAPRPAHDGIPPMPRPLPPRPAAPPTERPSRHEAPTPARRRELGSHRPRPQAPPPPAEPPRAAGRPMAAEPAHADAPLPATADGDDFEIRLGTTWTLRIGLAAIAVAAALFARTIVPDLPAAAKVALAYGGAWLLFGAGRHFEARLERFARPVMASGLALAFFVSFAAHFVPAMRAVPLAVSLVWMAAGAAAVLAFATRWNSQPTAALAIFLGHVTAYVAAADASTASLVAIAFLSVIAVALLLRHDWRPLSLFAIVAANGTHLLWALAAQGSMPRPTFMALNLAFLSSYYLIFLAADLLWWRRHGAPSKAFDAPDPGRAFGPTNLVLFVATAWWLLAQGAASPATSSAFFFAMAVLQWVVAVAVRRFGSPDDAIYLAAGTALLTIGLFARFDALALDLLLAALALLLLLVAHRARRRVFHLLAQAALATSFLQFWRGAAPPDGATAALLGGLAIAATYLWMAQLEALWYERDAAPWAEPTSALRPLQDAWDAFFRGAAPVLPSIHALAGALVLLRSIDAHLPPDAVAVAGAAAAAALTIVAIALRSLPLSLAWLLMQVGVLAFVHAGAPSPGVAPIVAAVGVGAPLLLAILPSRSETPFRRARRWIAQVGLWLGAAAIPPLVAAATFGATTTATYLIWIAVVALVFAFAAHGGRSEAAGVAGGDPLRDVAAPITASAGALLALAVTLELVGPVPAAPVWASGWGALVALAAWRLRDRALDLGAVVLVVATPLLFLVALGLGPAVAALVGASAAVVGAPLLLALAWDRRAPSALDVLAASYPYLLYASAALTWGYVVLERTTFPWFGAWAMLLPLGLLLAARRTTLPRARGVALTLTFAAALGQLVGLAGAGASATVWATGLTVAAVVAVERLAARPNAPVWGWLQLVLAGSAAALALWAVPVAAEFGATWRTAGWSLVAATTLALGFAWRTAAYRRVGLVAFALSLARVFVVDVRSLPTGAQTLAFLALGLSLVAVAWLYARFAGEIRRWL